MKCRFCEVDLKHLFVSLGSSPLANSYIGQIELHSMEPFYPLNVYVCEKCFLVQAEEVESPENIFSDYDYFSSFSGTWLDHSKTYVDKITEYLNLNNHSQVVEIASNDGYLLQYFIKKSIPALGIEPAANIAEVAKKKGVPTEVMFFGKETAKQMAAAGKQADLLLGNNVLAHVPQLNDFVGGLQILLKHEGVITMEFPHLKHLIGKTLFDTIYHEHFSYFSFITAEKVFAAHGLTIFDVEEFPIHGGSLRIYARHTDDSSRPVTERVDKLKKSEIAEGYNKIDKYLSFEESVRAVKRGTLNFLIQAKERGKTVVGYGAPAKGNTLLNYCGIRSDFIDYTVDKNPVKQGKYLPGSHLFIAPPDKILETKPDYLFIFPWNLKEEIMKQMVCIRDWGGKFVVVIPEVEVL